jgi:hypothetical protein
MYSVSKNDIQKAVKKHMIFAMFLALVPIVFIQSISYFSGDKQLSGLLIYISPIAFIGACAHFIKSVLIELNVHRELNT